MILVFRHMDTWKLSAVPAVLSLQPCYIIISKYQTIPGVTELGVIHYGLIKHRSVKENGEYGSDEFWCFQCFWNISWQVPKKHFHNTSFNGIVGIIFFKEYRLKCHLRTNGPLQESNFTFENCFILEQWTENAPSLLTSKALLSVIFYFSNHFLSSVYTS